MALLDHSVIINTAVIVASENHKVPQIADQIIKSKIAIFLEPGGKAVLGVLWKDPVGSLLDQVRRDSDKSPSLVTSERPSVIRHASDRTSDRIKDLFIFLQKCEQLLQFRVTLEDATGAQAAAWRVPKLVSSKLRWTLSVRTVGLRTRN